ncbi:MAG: helix-turn-helix transcriptional regulator [Gemmatimonadaceae bacterium]|jgi:transcriptional regulator with XRE-family HTH domain|nr:helix-turn-helix transcriptional regulator [Gemmatimonadaceae bacterium]
MSASTALPEALQRARHARRISQLELSIQLGVSQRHISFVERGRARPSRALLVAWLDALEAPLVVRNEVLLTAGFAPEFSAVPLSDPVLVPVKRAIARLLDAHDPMPAFVLDADWTMVSANRGAAWLAATVAPDALPQGGSAPPNMLDLLAHPDGLCRGMVNLREVAPSLVAQLRHEVAVRPGLRARAEAVQAEVERRLGGSRVDDGAAAPSPLPMLTVRYATPYGEVAFFSLFTTFGTPRDITLASLRVEHLFPADDATRAILAAQVS